MQQLRKKKKMANDVRIRRTVPTYKIFSITYLFRWYFAYITYRHIMNNDKE